MSLSERTITPRQRVWVLAVCAVLWLLAVIGVARAMQYVVHGQDKIATITRSADGETFTVSYTPGALNACTVFEDQRVLQPGDPLLTHFPEGHYAPQHCWVVDPDSTRYEDDWDFVLKEDTEWQIYAKVQYDTKEPTQWVLSNRVRVRR